MSNVTKLNVDMLDLPEISFEQLPYSAVMPIYVPRGDGTYRSITVTLGWIQSLFNNGVPGGGDTVTVVSGGQIDADTEIVFWSGGSLGDENTPVKLSGGVIT